tara:strand:- start:75 stop:950 length:876 start_codon:yes stop_codon:yes gene_type:complete
MPYFKRHLEDLPNNRSSHIFSTPRGLGIIFSLISIFFCTIKGFNQILYSIPLTLVGFADDLMQIPASYKYIVQFVVGIIYASQSPLNSYFFDNLSSSLNLLMLISLTIGFTGIVNFINFMDGIDGLIAGCFIFIILGSTSILNLPLTPIIFSLSAFLLFNWHPAKAFMGDSGSLFLGGIFGLILLKCENFNQLISLLLIASPLLLDALICLIRRLINNENIFTAHKKHLYQRLNQAGWTHSKVSILYISLVAIEFISIKLIGINLGLIISMLIICLGIYLEKCFATNFNLN